MIGVPTRTVPDATARWCALALLVCAGCATTPPESNSRTAGDAGDPNTAFDRARALLTLEQIHPNPPAPQAPAEGVVDLSARGVRRLSRARELYNHQRFTEAGIELDKALRHEPDHPLLHRELAVALRAAGNNERVRSHLRKAVALNDDDLVTHYLLGRLAFDDRQNAQAIEQYRIALKASNSSALPAFAALCHFYLAKALNAEGYLMASIAEYRGYEAAVAGLPPESRVDAELQTLRQINQGRAGGPISVAYEKLGRFTEAADALGDSIRDGQPDPGTREHLARLLAKTGRFDEALHHARLLFDHSDRAVRLLIDIHEQAGHPQDVIDDIRLLYERNNDRMDMLMAYVDALERFQRRAEVQRILLEAVGRHPGRTVIHWRLADVFREAGQWSDALDVTASAVRSEPQAYHTARAKVVALADSKEAVAALLGQQDQPPEPDTDHVAAYLLGSLAGQVGRPEQAELFLRHAIRHQPDFVPAGVELGRILLERFQWQAVIDLVSADAEALRADSRLERLCGQAYAGLDDFRGAEEHLNAAIRLNRADTPAMAALAEMHLQAGEVRRAQRQFEAIVQANPLHEFSREALIEIYAGDKERLSEAAAQVAELKRLSASPHRIARCGALLDHGGMNGDPDWDKYRETLTRVISEHGPDGATYVGIATSYLGQSRPAEALETLDLALALDADNWEALERRIPAYEQLLQYSGAIDAIKELLRRHPNRIRWIDQLWRVLIIDHRFDEAHDWAIKQLSRTDLAVKERDKQRARAVEALRRAKHHDRRIALLEGWHDENENDPRIAQSLIEAYAGAERYDDAIARAAEWHRRDPQSADAGQALFWALVQADRYHRAEQIILDVLEVDPDDLNAQAQLATTLSAAERYDDALELLDNLELRLPDNWPLRYLKLRVLQTARRYGEVARLSTSWLRELKIRGRRVDLGRVHDLQRRVGVALVLAQDYDEAGKKLRKWIDEAPNDETRYAYLRTLSQCHQNRGDQTKAIDALQQAYDLASHDVGVNNDLGYSLADAGIRLDEAERLIRYALVRAPNNGAYLDSMGWVLYKKGQFEQARHWLGKAVNTDGGGDPVVYDHLADANWRLGRTDEAVGQWNKSVEQITERSADPGRPDVRALLERVRAKLEAVKAGEQPETAPAGG